jgi:hypothetical protein
VVALGFLGKRPREFARARPIYVNGLPIYLGAHGTTVITYFVPSLSVELTAHGPLAQRVLHTFTRSPLDVVLAPGPAPVVPSSWRSGTFDGVSFSVPGTWPVVRTQYVPGFDPSCDSSGIAGLHLSTDTKMSVHSCPHRDTYPSQHSADCNWTRALVKNRSRSPRRAA